MKTEKFDDLIQEIMDNRDSRVGFAFSQVLNGICDKIKPAADERHWNANALAKTADINIDHARTLLRENLDDISLSSICRAADALGLSFDISIPGDYTISSKDMRINELKNSIYYLSRIIYSDIAHDGIKYKYARKSLGLTRAKFAELLQNDIRKFIPSTSLTEEDVLSWEENNNNPPDDIVKLCILTALIVELRQFENNTAP